MVRSEIEAGFRRVYSAYRSRAHKRNLAWGLSTEETFVLLTQACWYCGAAPERAVGRKNSAQTEEQVFHCGGIDRIDNSRGYEPDNVRPACWQCNAAKGNKPESEFYRWLAQVFENLRDRNVID